VVPFWELSAGELALLLAFWTASALLVFWHADKHGSKRATAWGVAAFLASVIVVPIYFLRHWWKTGRGSGRRRR
jgi:hypothetical protein